VTSATDDVEWPAYLYAAPPKNRMKDEKDF
jgi:hypothetical protein